MLVIPFISAIMSSTATKKSPSLKESLDHLRCKKKVALDCQAQINIQLMDCFKILGYARKSCVCIYIYYEYRHTLQVKDLVKLGLLSRK